MENSWFPIACVLIYMVGIVVGPKYMENRKPYVMKKTLAAWNLALAVFSFFGLIRGIPPLIHNFATYGFETFLCNDPQNSIGQSATGVWGIFFVLSKPAYVLSLVVVVVFLSIFWLVINAMGFCCRMNVILIPDYYYFLLLVLDFHKHPLLLSLDFHWRRLLWY